MLPAITMHERIVLAAAAEPNDVLRSRFSHDHQYPTFLDAESLMRFEGIDAVYIATPHQFHRDHVLLAARHGKHVVVEKPMALSLHECDEMIAAASGAGIVLVVGHTHSFDPAVGLLRRALRGGEFGRPRMISTMNFTDFLYRPRRPEELDNDKGGGILFNQVPHQVDIVRFLADAPLTSVRAASFVLDPSRGADGACAAFLRFADGMAATLTYSGYDRFDTDEWHDWVGEGGQPRQPAHGATHRKLLELSGQHAERNLRSVAYGYGGGRKFAPSSDEAWLQPHFGVLVVSCEKADIRQTPTGLRIYTSDGFEDRPVPPRVGRPGRSDVWDELVNAVTNGHRPLHDGQFGRATLEACLAIRESSRTGEDISLPLKTDVTPGSPMSHVQATAQA